MFFVKKSQKRTFFPLSERVAAGIGSNSLFADFENAGLFFRVCAACVKEN